MTSIVQKRAVPILIAIALTVTIVGMSMPRAAAYWFVSEPLLNDDGCFEWNTEDVVNVMWNQQGWDWKAEHETQLHTGWTDQGGATNFYFYMFKSGDPGVDCHQMQWQRKEHWWEGWHVRGSPTGENDPWDGDWSAGASHFDRMCHWHIAVDYDGARDTIRQAFVDAGRNTQMRSTYSGGSKTYHCWGIPNTFTWSGDVVWIDLTGLP